MIDFDGDGCTDEQELDKLTAGKCGDDPQNPSDSFGDAEAVDLSGIYEMLVRVRRGDCTDDLCTKDEPGFYIFCLADIQHDTSDNDIEARVFCYTDSVGSEINPEAFPGITGDGMADAPPPGPQDGNGNYAYRGSPGDNSPTVVTGIFNKNANWLELKVCFGGGVGVYMELIVSAHQLPGTADIWMEQARNCLGSPLLLTPPLYNGSATFEGAEAVLWQPNPEKGKGSDQDDDGVPTERELQDDSACGRRDPYNKNDYYDVSIPRDGVIDLPNDILGVILHFAPGGYAAGDENWDRPAKMAGAGFFAHWSRGTPDGVIDLPNDILGVILQFNPGGCRALS